MNISSCPYPEAPVLAEIREIVRLARKTSPACPGFPEAEDTERTWLLRGESGQLLSFLAVLDPDPDNISECIGITRPDARRKGAMRALLAAAESLLDTRDVLFRADGNDRETAAALTALGAEKLPSVDLLMALDLPGGSFSSENGLKMAVSGENDHLRYTFALAGKPAASCTADIFSDRTASFGNFEVAEPMRGKGIGTKAFARVLADLGGRNVCRVILHVESGNIPAVRLYKKAGFRVLETLSAWFW